MNKNISISDKKVTHASQGLRKTIINQIPNGRMERNKNQTEVNRK